MRLTDQDQARMRFIDFLLCTYGWITCHHVMEYFKVSESEALVELYHYAELTTGNIAYHEERKCYVSDDTYKPVWL